MPGDEDAELTTLTGVRETSTAEATTHPSTEGVGGCGGKGGVTARQGAGQHHTREEEEKGMDHERDRKGQGQNMKADKNKKGERNKYSNR